MQIRSITQSSFSSVLSLSSIPSLLEIRCSSTGFRWHQRTFYDSDGWIYHRFRYRYNRSEKKYVDISDKRFFVTIFTWICFRKKEKEKCNVSYLLLLPMNVKSLLDFLFFYTDHFANIFFPLFRCSCSNEFAEINPMIFLLVNHHQHIDTRQRWNERSIKEEYKIICFSLSFHRGIDWQEG